MTDQQEKLADYYGELGNQGLLDAYAQGPVVYQAAGWTAITTELVKRGLVDGAPPDHRTALAAVAPPTLDIASELAIAEGELRQGFVYVAVGLGTTGITYALASLSGGFYLVAWGSVVYGIIEIFAAKSRENRAHEAEKARTIALSSVARAAVSDAC